jgi:hypothetical protein
MDSTSENIANVVALLTAMISEQEDVAYSMVLESDPVELFSAMAGVLISTLKSLAEINNTNLETYLKNLGMLAFKQE